MEKRKTIISIAVSFIKYLILTCDLIHPGLAQTEGDIRLVGPNALHGRLEIYHNGYWGTVCAEGFDSTDAAVVCRQLGECVGSNAKNYTAGNGLGTIWLDQVSCDGSESMLSSCGNRGWGIHSCGHEKDVGVNCFGFEEGDLRLVGGTNHGRLEIFHKGIWGTICDDVFDTNDAKVACKQLKKSNTNVQVYTAANGKGTIWLDNLGCRGTEQGIDRCPHIGWGRHDCGHGEDVGIMCYGSVVHDEGDLRLVDGTCDREGRLEIYHGTQWGTICDDGFDNADALVACRQLRFSFDNAEYYTYGSGATSQIQLDDLNCEGRENRLQSCSHRGWNIHDCGHHEDVGIRCFESTKVHGYWGEWSSWGSCSQTCGTGARHRTRQCNKPTPSCGGRTCVGNNTESQTCSTFSCPVDGGWSSWNYWSFCSVSCGGGFKNRTRMCDAPGPANGGLYCDGSSVDIHTCNKFCCPVNGNWGSWSMWDKCNTTCGEGVQNRTRKCDNPSPLFGGMDCFGYDYEIKMCNDSDCSVLFAAKSDGIENESACSGGLLGGIAGGCIIATIVIIVTGQFAFRKLRLPKKDQRQQDRICHAVDANEVQLRSRPNEYEAPETSACRSNKTARQYPQSGKFEELVSDDTQGGIYDDLQGAINTNNAVSDADDRESTVYTNTAFSPAEDRESTVYENLKT